jgi:hypothetical protein
VSLQSFKGGGEAVSLLKGGGGAVSLFKGGGGAVERESLQSFQGWRRGGRKGGGTVVDVTSTQTPVVFRPRRVRWVAGIAAAAVVILFTVLSFGLHGSTGDNMGQYARGDQTAMIGLGVLIGLGILAFTRPRVIADETHVQIRNVIGGYDLPWTAVRAVRFDRNSPWATLELHDDETVPVHALQAADKEYAVEGVRTIRALHSAASA